MQKKKNTHKKTEWETIKHSNSQTNSMNGLNDHKRWEWSVSMMLLNNNELADYFS